MPTASKPRLMIVEDDPDLRLLLELAANRAAVFSAIMLETDGEAALAKIQALSADEKREGRPDLVFTDLDMPGMNGIELTRELQRSGRTKDIKVAVFTASNIPNDTEKAHAAGCVAVFRKPVGLKELEGIMKSLPDMWAGTAKG